jgi:Cu+-exporting ATPase
VALGVIGARDQIRPESAAVLAELRSIGIAHLALLTGDRDSVARSVAQDLGISEVHAELLPQEKAEFLTRWGSAHDTTLAASNSFSIAMVGDGINDAPALARADVGLAIGGSGTDLAAEAGDIVLMGDPLQPLPLLVRLSRQTVRIIRQNILIFAFGVNGLGIILTAWLWPLLAPSAEWYEQAPVAGVVYHQLGSLAVLLNALRLLWFERTSPTPSWRRLRHRLRWADAWLARHLDLHEFSHWLGHHARAVGVASAGLALVSYGLSGFVQVGPDEVAVVRRFGRPLHPVLGPGLHWSYPWPVDRVTRLQPDRIRTIEIGFRSVPASSPASLTWASPHAGDGMLRDPEEAVMITGDGNLVDLQATVRYCVDREHLADFLFEVRDPEVVLRATAESVLREAVAGRPFLDLLSSARGQFQEDVAARLTQRLQASGGLGVRLQGFDLHDLHPPQEVVSAYHDVTRAMEDRDRVVNEANAERTRQRRDAQVKAQQLVRQAEAGARETIRTAEAARDRFLALQQMRSTLSQPEELELAGEAMQAILAGRDTAAAYRDYDRRRQERLARQAALTDFRLFWEALGQALADRDKVIVDADQVPGRRQLWLFDPDQFRPPVLPSSSPPKTQRFQSETKARDQ